MRCELDTRECTFLSPEGNTCASDRVIRMNVSVAGSRLRGFLVLIRSHPIRMEPRLNDGACDPSNSIA